MMRIIVNMVEPGIIKRFIDDFLIVLICFIFPVKIIIVGVVFFFGTLAQIVTGHVHTSRNNIMRKQPLHSLLHIQNVFFNISIVFFTHFTLLLFLRRRIFHA